MLGRTLSKAKKRQSVSKHGPGLNIKPVDQNLSAEKLKKCAPRAAWLCTREDATKMEPTVRLPKMHYIDNQRTNGPVNAHLTSVSCFSIIFQI